MQIIIRIQSGNNCYQPVVTDNVSLSWERKGTPGKLTFDVVKDSVLSFQEGDRVDLFADGTHLFQGYVFRKKRNKGNTIGVTAYDQLRYLKNKDTIQATNITASQLLINIANDFRLQYGVVEDTGFVFKKILEENQTLFDAIQNALNETLKQRNVLYILYDDVGKLTLKNIETMKLDLLINADVAEDFDYETSIDDETYNKIKLTYDNDKTGMREEYIAQSGEAINRWGVLQYFETLEDPLNGPSKADGLLKLYNQKTRRLTVKNTFGDIRVRAGSAVAVDLNLGDMIAKQYMMVERVGHKFKENQHLMDLTLVGGEFVG